MGTKSNPGKFDCYTKAEPDEPMFVLLARDENAPKIVRSWAEEFSWRCRYGNPDTELTEAQLAKYKEALDCADAMVAWRKANRP
jgi:hypothetical protein